MARTKKAKREDGFYKTALWILLGLFVFRVVSQFTLQFIKIDHFPTFEQWHSNTLNYKLLLFFQIVIILMFLRICIKVSNQTLKSNKNWANFLKVFGLIYFTGMVFRYFMSMYMYPDMRWTGNLIPIIFHLVLASFLVVLGKYHTYKLIFKH
jgi:hypothetical protein